jgi:glutathione S-transferase
MDLFITPNSPYARKARVVVRELGLLERVGEVRVTLRDPQSALLQYGPVGRVPALLVGERLITEHAIVCEYLDSMRDGPRLLPAAGETRWAALELEGRALGLLDGVAFWVRELRRSPSERSSALIDIERARASRCLDVLENDAAAGRFRGPLTLAAITTGCTLGLVDFALAELAWRAERPALAAWYSEFAARPSMIATAPAWHATTR